MVVRCGTVLVNTEGLHVFTKNARLKKGDLPRIWSSCDD